MKKAINLNDIRCIPAITRTGPDFGNMVMVTIWCRTGERCDMLFDRHGEPITKHQLLPQLESYFEKSFLPGKIDGLDCLISQGSNPYVSENSDNKQLIFNNKEKIGSI